MKTHGICHAQSARKHRKAGHLVQELGDGRRYQWQSQGTPQMFGRLNGKNPTHVITDEFPIEAIARAFEVPVHMICDPKILTKGFEIDHTLSGKEYPPAIMGVDPGTAEGDMSAKAFKLDGYYRVAVGEEWYPKRRNQHTKPLRIVAITNGGMIRYDRGEGGPGQWIEYTQFCGLIGKRAP